MENTVLITGAGFSMPYGYPSGATLAKRIRNYELDGNERDAVRNLGKALKDDQNTSIDNFLNEHKQHESVGIELIARQIFWCESNSFSHKLDENEDIINLIINEIKEDDFHKLKIITFNYDRHLQWSLYRKFRQKYDDDKTAMEAVKKLQIIHVHGKMIPFNPHDEPDYNDLMKCVPYGLQGVHDASTAMVHQKYLSMVLQYAEKSFKTVHTNNAAVSNEIINVIKLARRIFFLGFGFDYKNMFKLGINHPEVKYDWSSKLVSGTCSGIKAVKMNEINANYPFLVNKGKTKLYDLNAKQLFQEQFSLRNSTYDASELTKGVIQRSCCEVSAVQQIIHSPTVNIMALSTHVELICLECSKNLTVKYSREEYSNEWNYVSLRKH